jgi:hypothetical protein
MNRQIFAAVFAAAALIAVYIAAPGAATAATCVPASNIEAIVDDSGSMGSSDPNSNRAEAIKILISKSGNAKKTLGAVEFGTEDSFSTPPVAGATTMFAPQVIGPAEAAMKAALDAGLKADHGATDYNAAFAVGKSDNPNATARIFITDGGHNSGLYAGGHAGGPPTYVLGMGIGAASATDIDATRLQQIANDTGGVYYPNVDSGNVNSTMNQVDAALNCQAISKTYTDLFKKVGQSKVKSLPIAASSKSVDLVLSWKNPLDQFTVSNITLKPKKGASITISKKRLKIKRAAGKTFLSVHISKLKKGKLKFKLKALKVTDVFTGVNLTTQATQGRRK